MRKRSQSQREVCIPVSIQHGISQGILWKTSASAQLCVHVSRQYTHISACRSGLARNSAVQKCTASVPRYRCGKSNHASSSCRFIKATCHYCQKKGHIAKVCWSEQRGLPPRTPGRLIILTRKTQGFSKSCECSPLAWPLPRPHQYDARCWLIRSLSPWSLV